MTWVARVFRRLAVGSKFSRAFQELHVSASGPDWFIAFFAFVVIG